MIHAVGLLGILLVFSPDQAGYDWVQQHRYPWLDGVMQTLTHSGDGTVALSGMLAGAILADMAGDPRAFPNLKAATLGLIGLAPAVVLLKGIFNRPRPTPPTSRWNASFPSGHAALAFYIAGYHTAAYPRWEVQIPLYLWAVGVAYSRVYLRRHWPTDVVVGALIGWTAGRLVFRHRKVLEELRF